MNSLQKEKFKENDEIVLLIAKERENVLRETFGIHRFKKSIKKLMKETDKELYNE